MQSFRDFLLESEEEDNVKTMISKLPPGHAKLLHGYKFKYQPGNTMKGDRENIGQIYKDKITVAAPWNYGREFTTLHEIAHLVYEYLMTPELKKQWAKLVKQTVKQHAADMKKVGQKTDALDQDAEELFCMSYAACYAKHKPLVYCNQAWLDFIKKIPGDEKDVSEAMMNLRTASPELWKEIDAPRAMKRKRIINFVKQAAKLTSNGSYDSAARLLAGAYQELKAYWAKAGNEFQSQAAPDGIIGNAHASGDENQVRSNVMETIKEVFKRLQALAKNPQPSRQDIGIAYQLINMGILAMLANHSPEWRAA